ncbi:unnamed protein product [Arabidopsis halleri]
MWFFPGKISNFTFLQNNLSCKPWNRPKFLGQNKVRDSRFLQPSHGREKEVVAATSGDLTSENGESPADQTKEIEEIFGDDMMQSMRMNYYPPCPQPNQVTGLTPHSDAVGLTILLQVNEVDGLQIKKNGKWVFVKPLLNAFIFNVGDVLEIITNGTYQSIEHRAVVNLEKERLQSIEA